MAAPDDAGTAATADAETETGSMDETAPESGAAGGDGSSGVAEHGVDVAAYDPAPYPYRVRVRNVTRADELAVTYTNGTRATVRLLGVDVPATAGESGDRPDPSRFTGIPDTDAAGNCLAHWGRRARGFADRILPERVTLRVDPDAPNRTDDGHLLAVVRYGNTSLNRQLVEGGFARASATDHGNASAYAALARATRDRGVRLWNCRRPPVAFRSRSVYGDVDTGAARGTAVEDPDCSDFASQPEAQEYAEAHDELEDLDADGDGRACEGLPLR